MYIDQACLGGPEIAQGKKSLLMEDYKIKGHGSTLKGWIEEGKSV